MLHNSTSSSRRKAPSLDPEDFASWSMMFQAHVGFEEWELFNKEEPQVHEDTLLDLLAANGDDTEASLRYEKKIRVEQKKWKRNSDQIRQQLVEALCENKQTKLMALEFQNLPTWEFYAALTSRVKDTSSQSLNYHTGILNAMKCLSHETRIEFADRLVAQFLVVMNLNGNVDETWRCERLLNGLKAHPKYQQEANLMELLPNQTWDTITNQLRQYDRSDLNLKKETANAAMQEVYCYGCGQSGHKRPDCPIRGKGGGKGSGHGRSGGNGNGKGFSGGRGGKHYGGKSGGGRGGCHKGGKGKNSNSYPSRNCNLCQKPGHLSFNCPHAKEFA